MIDVQAALPIRVITALLAAIWLVLAAVSQTPARPCAGGGSDPVPPPRVRRRRADDPTVRLVLGLQNRWSG